ncbi:hypothetical protein RFI_14255 [Reticulomyxa filosa]|uniref:Uncharacterized protein n=1 Tax=Reticulomyxa filosa TaxID=46433 RepID=X6NAA6_RETFI|nr:hypothetical protein RFI_14255 [Reticulomyxa filosa]|eukprot:ETO22936.1 hypothetical protein RFI_14255 [Reticulomyxa filosa]
MQGQCHWKQKGDSMEIKYSVTPWEDMSNTMRTHVYFMFSGVPIQAPKLSLDHVAMKVQIKSNNDNDKGDATKKFPILCKETLIDNTMYNSESCDIYKQCYHLLRPTEGDGNADHDCTIINEHSNDNNNNIAANTDGSKTKCNTKLSLLDTFYKVLHEHHGSYLCRWSKYYFVFQIALDMFFPMAFFFSIGNKQLIVNINYSCNNNNNNKERNQQV